LKREFRLSRDGWIGEMMLSILAFLIILRQSPVGNKRRLSKERSVKRLIFFLEAFRKE
jgi:hypothetical protein